MPTLSISLGSREITRVRLTSMPIILGSGPEAEVRLESRGVEARHARLSTEGGVVSIQDLQSRNGVLVGGQRIDGEAVLELGDVAHVGLYALHVHGDEAAPVRPTVGDEIGRLSLVAGGQELRAFEVHDGAVIGRDRTSWIPINDVNVSARHAVFRRGEGGGVDVEDLGSRSGIQVNGRRVSRAPLRDGDELVVGSYRFRFQPSVGRGGKSPMGRSGWIGRVGGTVFVLLLVSLGLLRSRAGLPLQLAPDVKRSLAVVTERLEEGRFDQAEELLMEMRANTQDDPILLERVRHLEENVALARLLDHGQRCLDQDDPDGAATVLLEARRLRADDPRVTPLLREALNQGRERARVARDSSVAAAVASGRGGPAVPVALRPVPSQSPPTLDLSLASLGDGVLLSGERRALVVSGSGVDDPGWKFAWSVNRGGVDPVGAGAIYRAPLSPGPDWVRVAVEAPRGLVQILVWTVDVEPWEVLGVEPVPREAEEAFWRGYRAVKDQRTLDRVVAERELNLALSLLGNDDHPYARRARVLLDQIPES